MCEHTYTHTPPPEGSEHTPTVYIDELAFHMLNLTNNSTHKLLYNQYLKIYWQSRQSSTFKLIVGGISRCVYQTGRVGSRRSEPTQVTVLTVLVRTGRSGSVRVGSGSGPSLGPDLVFFFKNSRLVIAETGMFLFSPVRSRFGPVQV